MNRTNKQLQKTMLIAKRSAFTLLELVVAMAMVAIMAASLYASMQIAFRVQKSSETNIEPIRTADLAFEFVRADLQNALPPGNFATSANLLTGSFVATDGTDDRGGDGDDLVFYNTANAPDRPDANGDVKKVELLVYIEDGSGDHLLVRRTTRNLLSSITSDPDEEVICRNIDGFNLRFYDGGNWLETWDSTQEADALPQAVEVTLTLKRKDASAAGGERVYSFVRVFSIPCAVPTNTTGLQ